MNIPPVEIKGFNGAIVRVKDKVNLKVHCANLSQPITHDFLVLPIEEEMICGMPLITLFKIGITNLPTFKRPSDMVQSKDPADDMTGDTDTKGDSNQNSKSSSKQQQSEPQLGPELLEAFDENIKTLDDPCCHPEARVHLEVDSSKLKIIRQYPIAEAYRSIVDKQVATWLEEKVIEYSNRSDVYCSPLWTVPKYNIDGSIDTTTRRVCLDARALTTAFSCY